MARRKINGVWSDIPSKESTSFHSRRLGLVVAWQGMDDQADNEKAKQMTNHVESRLAARQYDDIAECDSFRRGYSDGFNGNPKGWRMQQAYANSYSAGYWEGHADRTASPEDK